MTYGHLVAPWKPPLLTTDPLPLYAGVSFFPVAVRGKQNPIPSLFRALKSAFFTVLQMIEIKLKPSLSSCIETVAKRQYEKVLNKLLSTQQEDPQLLDVLELLRVFLESADFRQLRSRSEMILVSGKQVEFTLRSTNGEPKFEIALHQV